MVPYILDFLRSILSLTNGPASCPFWISVGRDRCSLSWLAPAEMKENTKAHVHREQSITLIGSHKSSFTIQTVPYLTCTWSLTFVYMEPLLHLSSYAKYRLDKKKRYMRQKQQQNMLQLSFFPCVWMGWIPPILLNNVIPQSDQDHQQCESEEWRSWHCLLFAWMRV